MYCPKCESEEMLSDSKVIDARLSDTTGTFRRRRECLKPSCKYRWTTYEIAGTRLRGYDKWIRNSVLGRDQNKLFIISEKSDTIKKPKKGMTL